jgi:hypothetical protein
MINETETVKSLQDSIENITSMIREYDVIGRFDFFAAEEFGQLSKKLSDLRRKLNELMN